MTTRKSLLLFLAALALTPSSGCAETVEQRKGQRTALATSMLPGELKGAVDHGATVSVRTGRFAGQWTYAKYSRQPSAAALFENDLWSYLSVARAGDQSGLWVRTEWQNERRADARWSGIALGEKSDQGVKLQSLATLVSVLGGGTIDVPEGDIWLAGKRGAYGLLLEDLSGVHIQTAGIGKTRFRLLTANGISQVRVIKIRRSTNIVISGGLTVDGNFAALQPELANLDSEQMAGFFLIDNNNVRIEDAEVRNVGGDAFRMGGSRGNSDRLISLVRPRWQDCGRNGITLGGFGFEDIRIINPLGGTGVDTQQIDFEPLGEGTYRNITILNPVLTSTGNAKDDYAIVISGKQHEMGISFARNVLVKGGRVSGTVLVRNGDGVTIEGMEQIRSTNPFRLGTVEIDYASDNVTLARNQSIEFAPLTAERGGGAIHIRKLRNRVPGSIIIEANTISSHLPLVDISAARRVIVRGNTLVSRSGASVIELQGHRELEGVEVSRNEIALGNGTSTSGFKAVTVKGRPFPRAAAPVSFSGNTLNGRALAPAQQQ